MKIFIQPIKIQSGFKVQKIFAGEKLIKPTENSPKKVSPDPTNQSTRDNSGTGIFTLHPKLSKNRKVNPRDIHNNFIFLKTVNFSE